MSLSIFSPWQYVSPESSPALKRYKYVGKDHSLYYQYILRPLVIRISHIVPLSLAPNVITLVGLSVVILTHILTWWYMPDLAEDLQRPTPPWVFVLNGLSFFAYQVLDNLDGLQARRTGTSSPLGLLFDHGCDAINAIVMTLTVTASMQSGASWKTWVSLLCSLSGFFLNTWEELYRGELILPIINAPNEGIFTGILLQFITAAWGGPSVWLRTIPVPTPAFLAEVLDMLFGWMPHWQLLGPEVRQTGIVAVELGTFFALSLLVCTGATLAGNVYNVYVAVTKQGAQHGFHGADSILARRYPFLHALTRLLPLFTLVTMANLWMSFSPVRIFLQHPRICCWLIGLVFAKSVMHVMLAHITSSEYHPLRKTLIPILFIGLHMGAQVFIMHTTPQFDERFLLFEMFAIVLASYIHMVSSVVTKLSRILEIPIFTVPKKKA